MKKGGGSQKGHKFENAICRQLSEWWTDGNRDDVFTRTASSGAKATQRAKRKKKTFGQYGDLQAADPIGQPLMDLCVVECKDGYAGDSIADLLDKEPRHKPTYESFVQQAKTEAREADAPYWLLIARRRGRQIMLYCPMSLWDRLFRRLKIPCHPSPRCILKPRDQSAIFGTPLKSFLDYIKPEIIRAEAKAQ